MLIDVLNWTELVLNCLMSVFAKSTMGSIKKFYQMSYLFKQKLKDDMENRMLLNVHQAAGLDGNLFYSNPVESTHFKFKNRIQ